MREIRPYGSARGAGRKARPYRDRQIGSIGKIWKVERHVNTRLLGFIKKIECA
jgi:hypothetical protein